MTRVLIGFTAVVAVATLCFIGVLFGFVCGVIAGHATAVRDPFDDDNRRG